MFAISVQYYVVVKLYRKYKNDRLQNPAIPAGKNSISAKAKTGLSNLLIKPLLGLAILGDEQTFDCLSIYAYVFFRDFSSRLVRCCWIVLGIWGLIITSCQRGEEPVVETRFRFGDKINCYLTKDGGHAWPGGLKGSGIGDSPSKVIQANDLLWNFFQQYLLP